jgi:putative ABC transport system substrate-binding protein
MKRREFITLLGGAAAWPLAARAQQRAMPVIGVLGSGSRISFEFALDAFTQGSRQQGYIEDRNVAIQYSWADGYYDLLPSMADEFVRRHVAIIVTFQGTVTAEAAKAATSAIPIVFQVGTDPVAAGLVAALNRPGGNLTGTTDLASELAPKGLNLLHELVPSVYSGWRSNQSHKSDGLRGPTQAHGNGSDRVWYATLCGGSFRR